MFAKTFLKHKYFNLFHATGLFWYSENIRKLRFSDVFMGSQKSSVVWNGLISTTKAAFTIYFLPISGQCFHFTLTPTPENHKATTFLVFSEFMFVRKVCENITLSEGFQCYTHKETCQLICSMAIKSLV